MRASPCGSLLDCFSKEVPLSLLGPHLRENKVVITKLEKKRQGSCTNGFSLKKKSDQILKVQELFFRYLLDFRDSFLMK
jgi:hypothetical protein